MNGLAVDKLKPFLLEQGLSSEAADKKMLETIVSEARRIRNTLYRRESLLKTLDSQLRTEPKYLALEKVKLPPFAQFLTDYYFPHKPGVFTSVIDNWEARHWTPRSLVGKVGADMLVEIQQGRENDPQYEANYEQYRKMIKFGDFIDIIESDKPSNDYYMTARNCFANAKALKVLKSDLGEDIGDGYMRSSIRGGDLILWLGPKGTITQLHYDPSNQFHIQIYGTKTFRFIPALQVPYIYNNDKVYSDVDLLNPDLELYPEFAKVSIIEINAGPGDCIYMPLGWWHHVVSTSPCIGLSFNRLKVYNSEGLNRLVDFPKGIFDTA